MVFDIAFSPVDRQIYSEKLTTRSHLSNDTFVCYQITLHVKMSINHAISKICLISNTKFVACCVSDFLRSVQRFFPFFFSVSGPLVLIDTENIAATLVLFSSAMLPLDLLNGDICNKISGCWFLPPASEGWGKVMFSVCSHLGGVPISHNALQHFPECHGAAGGGTLPGPAGGGYPGQGGYPGGGVPWRGVPWPGGTLAGGVPWPGGVPS